MILFRKKVLNEEILTLSEVKEILNKRAGDNPEDLTYLQKMTYDYVNEFCILSLEESLDFRNKLIEKFGFPIEIATQIVNLRDLPTIIQEIDIFLSKEFKKISEEKKQKLLDLILSYKQVEEEEEESEEEKVEEKK